MALETACRTQLDSMDARNSPTLDNLRGARQILPFRTMLRLVVEAGEAEDFVGTYFD